MNSIPDLIQKLSSNPRVVGLIEYGNARHDAKEFNGDYDLIAILDEHDPDVESVHFFVGETPVDLNLRTLGEIRKMERCEGFEIVLIDGRIIHDPSGKLSQEIEALRKRHTASSPVPLSPGKIGGLRHGAKHTLDKLRNGRHANTTLERYLLHQCVYWALPQYFEIRGLPYRGERESLAYLRQNEPDLHDDFEQFYAASDFDAQLRLMRSIEEKVQAPIGGPWRDGESVTFGDQAKGEEILDQLLGDGEAEKETQE